MKTIKPCPPYYARLERFTVLNMPDGKSVYKIYYISRLDRDKPELYEWPFSQLTQESFEDSFLAGGYEGIGFVIAFPHVTKIFQFSADKETILDVKEYITAQMQTREMPKIDGFHEFACLAEALIAAEEYKAWASARSVDEYLAYRCDLMDFPVLSNIKLSEYWPAK